MIKVCPIGSGSTGNCFYIGDDSSGVLIDAGVSCKGILAGLDFHNIDKEAVKGIFITHEHVDHIKGLKTLLKKIQVPIFASAPTLEIIAAQDEVLKKAQLCGISSQVDIGNMGVTPFKTPHDAVSPLGFRIEKGDRIVGYATDLGEVTPEVWAGLQGADLVVLEANYDDNLLQVSKYPYFLKTRIRSNVGHLSNIDSGTWVAELAKTGTGRFILAHLSKDNNMPNIARQQVEIILSSQNLIQGQDYILEVAKQKEPTHSMIM